MGSCLVEPPEADRRKGRGQTSISEVPPGLAAEFRLSKASVPHIIWLNGYFEDLVVCIIEDTWNNELASWNCGAVIP